MLRLVTLAAVLGVIGGLVGAFAFGEVSGQADAVALLATRVREQNLDANGLIRVHEQGTANVAGTVDVGNLPESWVVLVGENIDVPPGQTFVSDFFDTAGCSQLVVFVDPPISSSPSLYLSADGVTVNSAVGAGALLNGAFYYGLGSGQPIVAPKAAVAFGELAVLNKAWLFCSQ